MLKWGLGGALFAALCCFTPLLVVVVAGVGLSAITGWLDYALFPLLFFCLAVVAQALWLRAGRVGSSRNSGRRRLPLLCRSSSSGSSSALPCALQSALSVLSASTPFSSIKRIPRERHNDDGYCTGGDMFSGMLGMLTPLIALGAIIYLVVANRKNSDLHEVR